MKTRLLTIIGIGLIGLSFYSIGPELCNIINPSCIGSEHYRAVLPYFLVILSCGILLLVSGLKDISIWSFTNE